MILSVHNGSFSYKNTKILDNISFTVSDKNVLCILGSNGTGKTTLLKCILGLLKWEKGETYLDNFPTKSIPNKEFWKKIAYVPQLKNCSFDYTVSEMVLFGRTAHLGIFEQPSFQDRKIAMRALEKIGILYLKDKYCSQISGGEMQLVYLARAIAVQPQLLVLDEPETNLDYKNQMIILETINHLITDYQISCIMNTHYPSTALNIGTHALLLNQDKTYIYGKINDVITEKNLSQTFNIQVKLNEIYLNEKKYKYFIPISLKN